MNDELWMKRVLRLAERGKGRTSPNPVVGAVLVKNGRIVGEGYHEKAGQEHAEVIAIRHAGEDARGATLYLNLEPCTHHGRTPPCTPAVIAAGIKRIVVGMEDPNPLVKGKGLERLGRAGIDATVGVLEEDCRRLNEAFCKYIVRKEPFVILKAAVTLDGKIATKEGDSKWISGEASRRFVHRLRDQVDGIVVGIGTIFRDDPQLTARVRGGRDPYRIVLDSRLRIKEEARVFGDSPSKVIIATTELAPMERVEKLEKIGSRVVIVDSKEGRVDLGGLLPRLGEMGMMSLMVEGGSRVNGSFLEHHLIDKIFLFLSPKLIGDGGAPGVFGGGGKAKLEEAVRLGDLRTRRIGEDILIEAYVTKETE
jgi:diaminohydroxyphosphoribosylaminopyrimidine deaminase/5-amino-6-(5-phosphoribosylamino)uracil reductase